MDKQANHVDTHKYYNICRHLLPEEVGELPGKRSRDGDVRHRQDQPEGGGHPRLEGHHGVRQERDEHHLPHALGHHAPGVHPQAPAAAAAARDGRRRDQRRARVRGVGGVLRQRPERQPDAAERGAEEEDGVAHPHQVRVLHEFGPEEGQQQHEQQAVHAVVHVLHRGRVHVGQADGGQDEGEDDEEQHHTGHRGVLQLVRVPAVEALQLVVLEAVPVQQPRYGQLAVRVHGLDAVVHGGRVSRAGGPPSQRFTFG